MDLRKIESDYNGSAENIYDYQRSKFTKEGHQERRRVFTQLLNGIHAPLNNVLDIGCGAGTYFDIYQDYNLNIAGIDLSEKQLQVAQKNHPDAELYHQPFETFTPNKTFDLLVAIGVLTTVDDLDGFLSHVHKLLAEGKYFLFSFLNQNSILPASFRPPEFRFYRLKNITELLSQNHLNVIYKRRIYIAPGLPIWTSKLLYTLQIPLINHIYMCLAQKTET